MPTENTTFSSSDYNLYVRYQFILSSQYEYVTTHPFSPNNKTPKITHDVMVFQNKETGKQIAVAPLLTPDEIGELHTGLLKDQSQITEFFYSSHPATTGDVTEIQTLHISSETNTIRLYCDKRNCRYELCLMSTFTNANHPKKNKIYLEKTEAGIHYKILSEDGQTVHDDTIAGAELEGINLEQLKNTDIKSFNKIKDKILSRTCGKGHTEDDYTCETEQNILKTYPDLCTGQRIKRTFYGESKTAPTKEQFSTPLTAITGKKKFQPTSEEQLVLRSADAGTHFIKPEELKRLRELCINNGYPFSLDATIRLNEKNAYFYLTGFLLSDLSGFKHTKLDPYDFSILPLEWDHTTEEQEKKYKYCSELEAKGILAYPYWQGRNIERIPEIGRIFLDSRSEPPRRIAVMAPGYSKLDGSIKNTLAQKYDIVIQIDIKSNFSDKMREILEKLDFGITDMARIISLMFREPPTDAQPLMKEGEGEGEGESSYLSFVHHEAPVSLPTTPPTQRAHTAKLELLSTPPSAKAPEAATPAHRGVCEDSPRKSIVRIKENPVIVAEAKKLVRNLQERLPAEKYYASLMGLLQLNRYRTNEIVNSSGNITSCLLMLDNKEDSSIRLHKPCSLNRAKEDLSLRLEQTEKQIYFIEEGKKPLAILYFDGKETHLLLPNINIKRKPWERELRPDEDITVGEPARPINKISVNCGDNYRQTHLVFHALHERLLADQVVRSALPQPSTLDTLKSYCNFYEIHKPTANPSEDNSSWDEEPATPLKTDDFLYSLDVHTLWDEDQESAMVAAYRQIVTYCYKMGMKLVSRVTDNEGHDLAFIFEQLDPDQQTDPNQPANPKQYFIITHPSHPTVLPKTQLKEKVVAALESLKLPRETKLDSISFKDDPPKYRRADALSEEQQALLNNKQIKTIYDNDGSHPETRANLHFKRLVADYLAKEYRLSAKISGRYKGTEYTQAVIFQDHVDKNKYYVITHPHHKQTVSKKQLDRAVAKEIRERKGMFGENSNLHSFKKATRYFKDDRDLPNQSISVKRKTGLVVEESTYRRTELDNQIAEKDIVRSVMTYIGFQYQLRKKGDSRPPYKFAKPTLDAIPEKSGRQKLKEFWAKHKGKVFLGLGLAAVGVVAGLTFGLGLIPAAFLGAGVGLAGAGAIAASGLIVAVTDHREETRSERITTGIQRKYSSSLEIIQNLIDAHEPTVAEAPAAAEKSQYDLHSPFATLPSGSSEEARKLAEQTPYGRGASGTIEKKVDNTGENKRPARRGLQFMHSATSGVRSITEEETGNTDEDQTTARRTLAFGYGEETSEA